MRLNEIQERFDELETRLREVESTFSVKDGSEKAKGVRTLVAQPCEHIQQALTLACEDFCEEFRQTGDRFTTKDVIEKAQELDENMPSMNGELQKVARLVVAEAHGMKVRWSKSRHINCARCRGGGA